MQPLDVVAIGNALVDVLATTDDTFLLTHGLTKGSMALVGAERAEQLHGLMTSAVEVSGGSAANTMAALASLGATGAFVGRVRDDRLGGVFAEDIRSLGLEFPTPPATGGAATGRCLILVTPDAQRTMSTFLGAAAELGPDEVDEDLVARAAVTYLEGYLYDRSSTQLAFAKAADAAHAAGQRVALSLSDSFCVDRFREDFVGLVDTTADVLFCNEDELRSLYETMDFEEALSEASARCSIVAATRGAKGSVVVVDGERHDVAAEPVGTIVDTTGAGDFYAAGFLAGLTSGRDAATCGRLGSIAAAEVISHVGARPQESLAELIAGVG